MVRLFERHRKRTIFSLDGLWNFKIDPDKKGLKEKWFESFPKDAASMIVPSCWNNELGLYEYEGLAWYCTKFNSSKDNINLVFNGVTGFSEVYLDGVQLGGHYGGFTDFDFLVKNISPGEHMLVVSADNTHNNTDTIPLSDVDWYHYGGIIRSVEVMELEKTWIKDYKIDYTFNNDMKNVELSLNMLLDSLDSNTYSDTLVIYLNSKEIYNSSIDIKSETNIKLDPITVNDIKLWDIYSPNLYSIKFELNGDDITDRIGFRKIEIKDKKLLLNNKEVYVKGINRHEDHPDWGFAFPLKLMKKDIDIIKDMGCNAVRGSHYPNSKAFLDYLDQEGLLFWEEIPMWGFPEEVLKNKLVLERGLKMHEVMVKSDYHHPCIIIWSLHNEIATSTTAAFDISKAFVDKIRSLDTTRLISYASSHPFEDICFSLVDIISVNKYYGWYHDEIKDWDKFLIDFKDKLQKDNLDHLPIMITEFGAAAIYGDSTFEGPKWTENYQERLIEHTLNLFYKEPDIIGCYIWQFCDIRTSKEHALGRARSFNNKGILNEYRKPKLAYWTVKRIYINQ